MKNLFLYFWRHKILSLVILAVLGGGGYYGYNKWFAVKTTVRYVTSASERGVLSTSVSGTGQVSATNQVDIKAKVSGDVVSVAAVSVGDPVKTGTLLASLDARDALKSVRDAQANLESAQLALAKIMQPADALSITQSENALAAAQEAKLSATDDLSKSYEDGFNTVANAFLDLPTVMSGLNDILFTTTLSGTSVWNIDFYSNAVEQYDEAAVQYKTDAYNAYQTARTAYDKNLSDYKTVSRYSDRATIESLISESYDTTKDIAEAVKSANSLIQFYKDKLIERSVRVNSLADTHLASLNSYTGKTNTHLLNLLTIKRTIETDKNSIVDADRTITEKTQSLAKLKAGTDPLDIQSQKLSVQKSQNSLLDAREKLADYYIRAPFDGVLAAFSIKKGDSISAGATVGTIITTQQIATISLNEVDVAKVKPGQHVSLTFDAIDGLDITGEVSEVDSLGTVSQGVVSYNVKIVFDVQDERIKSGMSVSANIILSSKPDVLMVPASAVKSQGGSSYVQVLVNGAPQKKTVVTGVSNDTMTEIVSGLGEGEAVITQTITTGGTTAAPAGAIGGGGFGGGAGGVQGAFRALR